MARTRVIYQSEAVYCSNTAFNTGAASSGDIEQLSRVQSANYSFSVARQDVNQFGNLAAIDQIITESPTVSFDTSYYLANFANEERLGFNVTKSGVNTGFTSCIGNIIDSSTTDYQKNYYILTTKEGKDANDNKTAADFGAGGSLIGIGNAFLSSYSSEGAVGGLPTVSVSVEGQNMNFVNLPYNPTSAASSNTNPVPGIKVNGSQEVLSISGDSPAVSTSDGSSIGVPIAVPAPLTDPEHVQGIAGSISTLRPGDITLTLAKQTAASNTSSTVPRALDGGNNMTSPDYAGASINDAHIQSYNVSFDLSRSAIQKLGNKFAFARAIDFPITASLSIDAVLSDLTTGSLAEIINCDEKFDARITLKDPTSCDISSSEKKALCNYVLKGLKLDSQSFSSDIGSNKTVTLDFSTQIGGPDQFAHGIFMSGARFIA
tara:strand:+ start:1938 stop:3233 length:1296 start_codon:yes stop_codon:yes gene_type:complete